MSGYVTLLGTEQVQSAANRMASAADDMRRAASSFDTALRQHEAFLDGWLIRLQTIIEEAQTRKGTLEGVV